MQKQIFPSNSKEKKKKIIGFHNYMFNHLKMHLKQLKYYCSFLTKMYAWSTFIESKTKTDYCNDFDFI